MIRLGRPPAPEVIRAMGRQFALTLAVAIGPSPYERARERWIMTGDLGALAEMTAVMQLDAEPEGPAGAYARDMNDKPDPFELLDGITLEDEPAPGLDGYPFYLAAKYAPPEPEGPAPY